MTTDERLAKLEAWIRQANGRNLAARVEALEKKHRQSPVLVAWLKRVLSHKR